MSKVQILKSQITGSGISDFHTAVLAQVRELTAWQKHQVFVEAEKDTPFPPEPQWGDFAGHDDPAKEFTNAKTRWAKKRAVKRDPIPRPIAHPLVEAAVKTIVQRDGDIVFIPDYEIVNDDPTDEQVLRLKKNALLGKIHLEEQNAIEAALPAPGRRRLLAMQAQDIKRADDERISALIKSIDDPKARAALDIPAETKKLRPPEDTQLLDDQESTRERATAIQRAGAEAMSAVEDLTLKNIDTFKIPTFD